MPIDGFCNYLCMFRHILELFVLRHRVQTANEKNRQLAAAEASVDFSVSTSQQGSEASVLCVKTNLRIYTATGLEDTPYKIEYHCHLLAVSYIRPRMHNTLRISRTGHTWSWLAQEAQRCLTD